MSMSLQLGNGQEMLKEGSTGLLVKQLQERLAGGGFNPGQVDGIFGPKTREAVIQFQNNKGLAPDGIVGTQTWAALMESPPAPPPSPRMAPVYAATNVMSYLPWILGGLAFIVLIGATKK